MMDWYDTRPRREMLGEDVVRMLTHHDDGASALLSLHPRSLSRSPSQKVVWSAPEGPKTPDLGRFQADGPRFRDFGPEMRVSRPCFGGVYPDSAVLRSKHQECDWPLLHLLCSVHAFWAVI